MKRQISFIFCIFTNLLLTDAARILGVVLTPSFSHQVAFRTIWRELSLRGHQLVVLTTDSMNDPTLANLTEIDLHFSYDIWTKRMGPLMNDPKQAKEMMDQMVETMNEIMVQQLSHSEVRKLLDNEAEHFDLAIVEVIIPLTVAFSTRFKCPCIGMTSIDPPAYFYSVSGNIVHPIVNPDVNFPLEGKLNFFERIQSVVHTVIMGRAFDGYLYQQDGLVEKYIGKGFPHLSELISNISLFFINTNPILYQIRPLMPNVIQIGDGIHLISTKKLPKDLQNHLDSATEGFIYFSLGTNVKSKDLTDNVRTVLLDTFVELPYKILWKFELEDLPNKPDNVNISKWFPQQEILHHPNIKLFITQGGIQSIDESIYAKVPMLGLPFFLDQVPNVKRMVANGLGLSLDYKTLDKETLKKTILEVINNPKYRERAKQLADLIKDQPMTGLEKVVWWTEYVIRHKGAKHLRSPMLDIPSYQYYLLDVMGFCLVAAMVVIILIVYLIKLTYACVKKVFGSMSKQKLKTK